MQAHAQEKFDLNAATLREPDTAVLAGLQYHKGLMYDRSDMISYGVDNAGHFSFWGYIPSHVELLTYKGSLAGYAFQIHSFNDQEKIKADLLRRFPGLKLIDSTRWVSIYHYANDAMVVEFRTIPALDFHDKRSAYLDIKSRILFDAIEAQEEQYRHPR